MIIIISGMVIVYSALYMKRHPESCFSWTWPDALVLAVMALTAILASGHVFTWWDDLNFWATDVKSLFYLNGFPGKYGNVAPEFGDYPPGTQMMKWLFLKLSGTYKEGLAFSGYYVSILIFLLPVLGAVKKKNKIIRALVFLFLCFIPGICNIIWSQGTAADIVMSLVYGSLLVSIVDSRDQDRIFYYGRIAVFSSLLCLCKSTGFEWALFALCFYLIWINKIKKEKSSSLYSFKGVIISAAFPLITEISWMVFCLVNRRIAKLTSSGVYILKGGHFVIPGYVKDRVRLFFEGLLRCPMHTEKTNLLNLSTLAFILILIIVLIIMAKNKILNKFEGKLLVIYLLITAIISYGIVLLGHATLFSMETQYDTAEMLTISFSRYCAPFTLGMFMLILFLILERVEDRRILALCGVFVLLSADFTACCSVLAGYRSTRETDISQRDAVLNESSWEYVDRVSGDKKLWGHRVLVLRDASYEHRVLDTYTNYYASPVPTVYASLDMSTVNEDEIKNLVEINHPTYVYFEPQESENFEKMTSLMMDCDFKYATIYEIVKDGNNIKFKEVSD